MDDLKLIKKHYGEKMMHLCRELFPSILEVNGLLFNMLSKSFNYTKSLYEDIINDNKIEDFKNFIYNQIDVENDYEIVIEKTPQELLGEAAEIYSNVKEVNFTQEEIDFIESIIKPMY